MVLVYFITLPLNRPRERGWWIARLGAWQRIQDDDGQAIPLRTYVTKLSKVTTTSIETHVAGRSNSPYGHKIPLWKRPMRITVESMPKYNLQS
jgi:hypothetical protein